jgi:maltose O-acetyltransferase
MMTEKQKMLAGQLYDANDPELVADRAGAEAWMARYNALLATTTAERLQVLRERLARAGDGSEIRPPFHCDYGSNIALGSGVFLNFGCVILDVTEVTIDDGTQIGATVQIYTADHPRDPAVRRASKELGLRY